MSKHTQGPHDIARKFGFIARTSLDAVFIRYPQGANSQYGTDEVARIDHKGDVALYVHDAQAALCAAAIAKAEGR